MEKAIIGRKIGMSQIFDEAGKVIPVTVIEAGPCVVVQKKTEEKDGYNAVQLGFQDIAERKLTKPEQGHLKKAEVPMKKVLKEFKLNKAAEMNVGDEIKADTFAKGDHIDVTGISKGKGYQGVIKRWNAGRGRMTHGGIVFAPKPRDYSYRVNRKLKRLALKSVLSAKAASGDLLVVDNLALDAIKTKSIRSFLDAVSAGKTVLVTPEVNENVYKSARNIPGVSTTTAKILSVYDIVNAEKLVIDQKALAIIEEVFA